MNQGHESLSEYIDRLGDQLEVSQLDRNRIRAMFLTKGISLQSSAAPYASMLQKAFANIRYINANTKRTKDALGKIDSSQQELQDRLQDALRRLQAASSRLKEQAAALRKAKGLTGKGEPPAIEARRKSDAVRTRKTPKLATGLGAPALTAAGFVLVTGPKELQ